MKPLLLFLAQAATATPAATPEPTPESIFTEAAIKDLPSHLQVTLTYVAVAIVVYLLLLFLGRMAKRRLGVPLGWFYHMFCFAMALFVPSLFPQIRFAEEQHIKAAAVLTATFVAISFVRHCLFDTRVKSENATLPKFVSQVVSIVITLVACTFVVRFIYGGDVSGFLAGAGIVGIVLGLALQDTLGNLFSGFAIYFGGQFKAGDWLLIEGHHAQIVEINWRSTRLRTEDDIYLDIPNSNITKQTVINYDYPNNLHGMLLEIGLDYEAPPSKVREVLIDAALDCSYVLREPEPNVYLKEFAASSVNYELRFWLNNHAYHKDAYSEIRTNLWYSLRRHGISIPYPIQAEYHHEFPPPRENVAETIREALKQVIFYPCLTAAQFDEIVSGARIVTFGREEKITRLGEAPGPMWIFVNGRAEVTVESHGVTKVVATIGPGDCIGEMSIMAGELRSATIRALEDCEAVELTKETLAPVMAASPELIESLSDLLAKRRLQNEGLLAEATGAAHNERQKDYRAGFLQKIKSFFEI